MKRFKQFTVLALLFVFTIGIIGCANKNNVDEVEQNAKTYRILSQSLAKNVLLAANDNLPDKVELINTNIDILEKNLTTVLTNQEVDVEVGAQYIRDFITALTPEFEVLNTPTAKLFVSIGLDLINIVGTQLESVDIPEEGRIYIASIIEGLAQGQIDYEEVTNVE